MPLIGDTTILWYQIDSMSDELMNAIRQIPHNFKLCFSKNQLFENIASLTAIDNKLLFVLSGTLDNIDSLLSSIDEKKEIHGIFIYDNQKSYEINSVNKYSKLYGIFVDYKLLLERLSKTVRILIRQQMIINIGNEDMQKRIRDLTRRSEAMGVKSNYLQRLQLMRGQARKNLNKEEFLKRCRSFYSSNQSELNRIDEFECTYLPKDALKWYTKDCFFFKIINFLLRDPSWIFSSEDIHEFVANICSQLKEECKKNPLKITRFYRGSNLTPDEIDWMRMHTGQTISISGFLSTSKTIDVATMFAENVLFDIELDPTFSDIIYADISKYSLFQDEDEVLFDFDTIFQIVSFQFDQTINLWRAKLIISNNSENIIISHLNADIQEKSSFDDKLRFGRQLRELNRMNRALNHFQRLFNSVQNDMEKFFVCYELGLTYFIERDLNTSLTYIQLASDIIQKVNHPDPNFNSNDYQRLIIIGLIYASMQNYYLALEMFYLSLNYIYCFDISHSSVNPYYIFIERLTEMLNSNEKSKNLIFSVAYWLIKDYRTAEKYLQSMENDISNEDCRFLILYHSFSAFVLLGLGYRILGYERKMLLKAHEHFNRVLELAQKSNNDSVINTMLENIAWLYEEMRRTDLAIQCYSTKMRRLDPRNKMNISRIFQRVCQIYIQRKHFHQAIEYCYTTLAKLDVNNDDDDDRKYPAIIREYLGDVYKELKDYNNAISSYQKSLELDPYGHDFNKNDTIIQKLNTIYEQTKEFYQAIEYYSSLLLKFQENNILLANIHASLGDMYKEINDLIKAINYYEDSIEQRLKHFDYHFVYLTTTKLDAMYQQTEEFDRAIEYYQRILSQFDLDDNFMLSAIILEYLGDGYIRSKDLENGLISYQKSVKFQSSLQSLNKIHQIYITTQQFDKAIEYYQTALLQTRMNEDKGLVALFHKYLGDSFSRKNDSINSLLHYTKSLELHQQIRFLDDSSDIIQLVDIVYLKTQQFDRAIEYYQTIVWKLVKHSTFKCIIEINQALENIYKTMNESVNAIIHYDKLLTFYQSQSDNYAYQIDFLTGRIGDLLLTGIDNNEMIDKSKIHRNGSNALGALDERLAFWYSYVGKLDLAKKHLHIALKYNEHRLEDMTYVNLHIDIGNIEERMTNYNQALDHFKTALNLITDKIELQGQLHQKIAYLYRKKGQPRLARYHYRKAVAIYRQCDPIVSLQQSNKYESDADSSSEQEDYISAIYFTIKSLRFHRKRIPFGSMKISSLLNQIGWFYCLNGQYKKALRFCINSLELFEKYSDIEDDPEQSYVLHSIGFIYLRLGDDQKAKEYCQKSMNILQQNPDLENSNQILADIFELFADIYIKQGFRLLAMENYKESLEKLEDILPKRYLAIERVRNSLEKINQLEL